MKRVRRYWDRHFLGIDFCLALLVGSALWIYAYVCGGESEIEDLLNGSRSLLYVRIATSALGLMGFVFTGVSILTLALSSPRLRLLRKSGQVETIWRVCFQCLAFLALVAVLGFAAVLADSDKAPVTELPLGLATLIVIAAVRLFRVLWVVRSLVRRAAQT